MGDHHVEVDGGERLDDDAADLGIVLAQADRDHGASSCHARRCQ
jgi:hypothetical protein